MIRKTYKYRLYPTKQQAILLAKHFGCCRFVYNWALEKRIKHYKKTGKTLHKFELSAMLTKLKKEKRLEFLNEVTAQSLHQSVNHLHDAYEKFFSCQNEFPKFKKKSGKQSCEFPQCNRVDFDSGKLFVIKFKEGIHCNFHRRFEGKIKKVTINKKNDNFFASILIETPGEVPPKPEVKPENTIGIDVGLSHFATLSTGEKIDNPRFLKSSLKRLKVLQRRAGRKKKGSANQKKAYRNVAKFHEKITNQRSDFLHKLTTRLIRENKTIVAETLNIKGMVQNRCLAQSISDVGWGEMFRQLAYKSEWYGKNFYQIGQFEPSSKTCSHCGAKKEKLDLSERTWTCTSCLAIHDRDANAAENIKWFGLKKTGQGMPEGPAEVLAIAGPLKQETLF